MLAEKEKFKDLAIKNLNINQEEYDTHLNQLEKTCYELYSVIKDHKNEIPQIINNYFSEQAKKSLQDKLKTEIDIDIVSNIEDAKKLLQENDYNLIIADLGLPEKAVHDYYGIATTSIKIRHEYGEELWKELDDLIPIQLSPLIQELEKQNYDIIKGTELSNFKKNIPMVYFTNRGHGEPTIVKMFEQGYISDKAKNDFLELEVTESKPFVYAENLYTGDKQDIHVYAKVVEDALKRKGETKWN